MAAGQSDPWLFHTGMPHTRGNGHLSVSDCGNESTAKAGGGVAFTDSNIMNTEDQPDLTSISSRVQQGDPLPSPFIGKAKAMCGCLALDSGIRSFLGPAGSGLNLSGPSVDASDSTHACIRLV